MEQQPDLLTPAELGELLRRPISSLSQWRHRKVGPAYVRVGRRILYRRTEVDRWLRQQEQITERSTPAA